MRQWRDETVGSSSRRSFEESRPILNSDEFSSTSSGAFPDTRTSLGFIGATFYSDRAFTSKDTNLPPSLLQINDLERVPHGLPLAIYRNNRGFRQRKKENV